MRLLAAWTLILIAGIAFAGCVPTTSSKQADQATEQAAYQPIAYSDKLGPTIVVIPGEIKASNATYTQKVTSNSIADFAELELSKAHYTVIERSDLGPMLHEIEIAANLGDAKELAKFKKGKFKAAKFLVRIDILKAEPTTTDTKKFNGSQAGSLLSFIPMGGAVAGAAVSSVNVNEVTSDWLIGIRYKILDANTGEQAGTDYIEETIKITSNEGGVAGVSQSKTNYLTLDSITQRLVQKCVASMDKYK